MSRALSSFPQGLAVFAIVPEGNRCVGALQPVRTGLIQLLERGKGISRRIVNHECVTQVARGERGSGRNPISCYGRAN